MDGLRRAATSGRRARADALLGVADATTRGRGSCTGTAGTATPTSPAARYGWAPLLYVTHSVYASVRPGAATCWPAAPTRTRPSRTSTARCPRSTAPPASPTTPSSRALLLEAGANPDDGESVYHATEAVSPDCLRGLLEHGATRRADHARPRARRRAPRARAAAAGRGRRSRRSCSRTRSGAGAGRRRSACWPSAAPTSSTRAARCGASQSGCAPPTSTRSCATARRRDRAGGAGRAHRRRVRRPRRSPRSRAASGRRSSPTRPRLRPAGGDHPGRRAAARHRALRPRLQGRRSAARRSLSLLVDRLVARRCRARPRPARRRRGAGRARAPWSARGWRESGRDDVAASSWSRPATSSSRSTWSRPTVRSPSGSQHDAHAEPERHVIGPLAALRERRDRREEATEHGEVEPRDREPAERGRQRLRLRRAARHRARPPSRARARGAPARPRRAAAACSRERGSSTRPSARAPSSGSPPSSERPQRRGEARRRPLRPGRRRGRLKGGGGIPPPRLRRHQRGDRDVLAVGGRAVDGVRVALGGSGASHQIRKARWASSRAHSHARRRSSVERVIPGKSVWGPR